MTVRRGIAILLWATDADDAARCATPFFHAAAAAAMEAEVEMYFTSRSVRLLLPGVAAEIRPGGGEGETLLHFMRQAHANGARFYACPASLDAFAWGERELIPLCDGIAGAAAFMGRMLDGEWASLVY